MEYFKDNKQEIVNNNNIIIIVNIFYLNQKLSKTIHTSVIAITAPETGYLNENNLYLLGTCSR